MHAKTTNTKTTSKGKERASKPTSRGPVPNPNELQLFISRRSQQRLQNGNKRSGVNSGNNKLAKSVEIKGQDRKLVSSIPNRNSVSDHRDGRVVSRNCIPNRKFILSKQTQIGPNLHALETKQYNTLRSALFSKDHQRYHQLATGSVPVAQGLGSGPLISNVQTEGGDIKTRICGMQYLFSPDIQDEPGIAGYRIMSFPITPQSTNNTATFLGTEMYSMARLIKMSLHYVSTCASTESGSLISWFAPNPDWVPSSSSTGAQALAEAYESMNFMETQAWQSGDWDIGLPDHREVFTQQDLEDPGETCLGYLNFMVSSGFDTSAQPGHYILKSEWEFFNRQLNVPAQTRVAYGYLTFALAAYVASANDPLVFESGVSGVTITDNYTGLSGVAGNVLRIYCLTTRYGATGTPPLVSGLGITDAQGLNLATVGTTFWVTEFEAEDESSHFQFFADRRAALSVFDQSTSPEAATRGELRWESSSASVTTTFDAVGYCWTL